MSSLNEAGVFDATFDEQDRILTYGDLVFEHAPSGEVISKTDTFSSEVTQYAHDAMGNLRGVVLPDGAVIEYLVDGEGRRVGKKVDGVLERGWLWRGRLQPVAELDASGVVVKRFVYAEGVNVPELMVTATATYRLVKDHLGSVRYVVDVATGAVAQELRYDAWGRVPADTSPGLQPFGFAGGLYDPDTGLVRFGAREYDAETGRWLSKDPIRFDGGDANIYAYVGNDPVNYVDPAGLHAGALAGGALGAGGIAAGLCLATPGCPQALGQAASGAAEAAADAAKGLKDALDEAMGSALSGAAAICVAMSSDDESERERCKRAKKSCIDMCTEETIPTGTYDGMPFHKCMRICMGLAGCP